MSSLLCSIFALYLMLGNVVNNKFIPIAFLALGISLIGSSLLSMQSNVHLKQIKATDKKEKIDHNNIVSNTNELLPEADFSNNTPSSVVENTTKKLKEKVIRHN